MSIVRYAIICDQCEARSPEYGSFPTCRDCGDAVCSTCSTNFDYESDRADCLICVELRKLMSDKEEEKTP